MLKLDQQTSSQHVFTLVPEVFFIEFRFTNVNFKLTSNGLSIINKSYVQHYAVKLLEKEKGKSPTISTVAYIMEHPQNFHAHQQTAHIYRQSQHLIACACHFMTDILNEKNVTENNWLW